MPEEQGEITPHRCLIKVGETHHWNKDIARRAGRSFASTSSINP
jgi:hypothetical protein